MAVKQYKRCNDCGARNEIEEEMCIECFGTNFTLISSSDNEKSSSSHSDIYQNSDKKNIEVIDDKTIIEPSLSVLKLVYSDIEKLIYHNDVIGRQAVYSEILQDNKTVSRQHAKFSFDDGEWYIEDLNSTNGTYVDDERVMPGKKVKILNGSEVKFSSSFLVKVLIGD